MVIKEIQHIKSDKKALREFGIVIGSVLVLLAGLLFLKGKSSYPYFAVPGTALFIISFTMPVILKPLQKSWMTISILIGWVMTRVILTILFYLVVTPFSIIAGLFGQELLDTKFDKRKDSYWIPKKKVAFEKKNYENQF